MSYKKIISVILSLLILLHPFSSYADDIAVTSTRIKKHRSTSTQTVEISNAERPESISPTLSETSATDEATLQQPEIATDSASMQDSEEPSTNSTLLTEQVQNTNNTDVHNTINSESSTGENHAENNSISTVDTGDASTSTDVITLANNNVVGTDIHEDVVNITHDNVGDINLSEAAPCSSMSEAAINDFVQGKDEYRKKLYESIYNSNKARIINNITIIATTGDNSSKDIVNTIDTGDANVTLNVFNMVNTNLIGNCGYFGVINVYGNQTGDIILPYELGYLGADSLLGNGSQNAFINSSTAISNSNDASVENNIDTEANTGGNTAAGYSQIQTGTSISNIRLADTTNTNITGDRWALVLVNYYGTWEGEVEGWTGYTESGPHSILMWVRLPSDNPHIGDSSLDENNRDVSSDQSIQNNNGTTVENNIRLAADTGNNSAYGRLSTIKTGNASVTLNEATVANTNIVGNNWFFAIINIFGNFVGNIIFPRPDVVVTKTADKFSASVGEDVTYTISFTNKGTYKAENVQVNDVLPSNGVLISYSSGGFVANNTINWSVGTLSPGQSGTISVIVQISDTQNDVVNTVSISTTTNEPVKNNNSSSAVTHILKFGGSELEANSQNFGTQNILSNQTIYPSWYYRTSKNPVSDTEIDSLFANQNESLNQQGTTAVLSLKDYADTSGANNICKISSVICAGAGISVVPIIYMVIKRRKFYS